MRDDNTAMSLLELVEDFIAELSEQADEGVYVTSVAARLVNMHPNTLRKYERAGILSPERTPGRQRLYSEVDIDVLRLVRVLNSKYVLSVQGLNLIVELVYLIREVLQGLERAPSLQNSGVAQELAKIIRHRLKQL